MKDSVKENNLILSGLVCNMSGLGCYGFTDKVLLYHNPVLVIGQSQSGRCLGPLRKKNIQNEIIFVTKCTFSIFFNKII